RGPCERRAENNCDRERAEPEVDRPLDRPPDVRPVVRVLVALRAVLERQPLEPGERVDGQVADRAYEDDQAEPGREAAEPAAPAATWTRDCLGRPGQPATAAARPVRVTTAPASS